MNKWAIVSIALIICIFGILIYFTSSQQKTPDAKLPPGAEKFTMLSPSPGQAQGQTQGAQTQVQPTFGVEEGVKASYSATIQTSKGVIQATIIGQGAPKTVRNFIQKANSGYYKNLTFHRVEDWVVQGGDPKGDGSGGNLVQTELNDIPFVAGSLGIAGVKNNNGQIVSNDSQFFITKTDAAWLNEQYTNFGMVTSGMDVVNRLTKGDKILSITVKE